MKRRTWYMSAAVALGATLLVWCGLADLQSAVEEWPRTSDSKAAEEAVSLPVLATVAAFELREADGAALTRAHLSGRVWLALLVPPSCGDSCAAARSRLQEVAHGLADLSQLRVLELGGAAISPQDAARRLARDSLGLGDERPWHVALVDKSGRVRGRYDVLIPAQTAALAKLARAMDRLPD